MTRIPAAITMRVGSPVEYNDPRDALSHDWARFLEPKGFLPIPIPNALENPVQWVQDIGVQTLFLSGGGELSSPADENIGIGT